MAAPFLLCDPGLLLPPVGESVERHHDFWKRLLAWSTDRRVRIGLNGHEAVVQYLTRNGWPDYNPPNCPTGLAREARRAIGELLAAVVTEAGETVAEIPDLDPAYTKDSDCGMALAIDVAEQHQNSLVGAASHEEHWERSCESVALQPPPPEKLAMAFEPHRTTESELDMRVAKALDDKRVTIVGGGEKPEVAADLKSRFSLAAEQVIWIEAERGKQPDLYRLGGIRAERDVIVCVTGKIGHAGSDKLRRLAARSGIDPHLVERPSEIAESLRARLSN